LSIQTDRLASYKLFARALKQKGYVVDIDESYPMTVAYTSPKGATWKTKAAHITYPFNTEHVQNIARDKNKAYDLARSAGFSIPYTFYVTDSTTDDMLLDVLHTFKKLIVKPTDLSQSKGLTIDIDSLAALKDAIGYAKSFSNSVLVQQQVIGEEIRFTVINGKVEAALLRRTARVIGDGHSPLAELINRENEARKLLHFDYITYPQLDETIVDSSLLNSSNIPDKGKVVELSHSTMVKGGCSIYDILLQVNKSYITSVEKLVAKLGAGFIVVDVFCQSYSEPARPDNHWFIEFNTTPALRLYYACRDGKQFDIVTHLAAAIDHWLHKPTD